MSKIKYFDSWRKICCETYWVVWEARGISQSVSRATPRNGTGEGYKKKELFYSRPSISREELEKNLNEGETGEGTPT